MTATAALIARLLLAAVFAGAGAAKLLDRAGTREAVTSFGAPAGAAAALAVVVPLVELMIAVLLLPVATARAAGLASLVLLGVFSAAIGANLMRGRTPDCHCFGQLHSAPAGPRVLIRNAALAGLAGGVLAYGSGRDVGDAIDAVPSALWLAAIGVLGLGLLRLLRAYGRVLLRAEALERALAESGPVATQGGPLLDVLPPRAGLAPGTPAPAFELPGAGVGRASLDELLADGRPLMLVFASPSCGPCSALMPSVARWQHDHADRLTVAVASNGAARDVRAEQEELGLAHVLVDDGGQVYESYGADGTPGAVLIAPDGTIASWMASGEPAIARLLAGVVDASGLSIGAPAPSLQLASLDGEAVRLDGSTDTVVLFWNPDCGYCRQMHEELLAWEGRSDRPRLLVVSSGDPERTREDAFKSTVVIDSDFAVARSFGVTGTPSAVLLDAGGRVASVVMAGTGPVMSIMGVREAVPA